MLQLQLAKGVVAMVMAGWLVVSGIVINPNQDSNFEINKEEYEGEMNYEVIIKEESGKVFKHTFMEEIDGNSKWFNWNVEITNKDGEIIKEFYETGFGANMPWDEFEESLTPDEKENVDKMYKWIIDRDYEQVKKELELLAKKKSAEQKAKERWFNNN